jgi:hypothetical protein
MKQHAGLDATFLCLAKPEMPVHVGTVHLLAQSRHHPKPPDRQTLRHRVHDTWSAVDGRDLPAVAATLPLRRVS